MKTIIIEVQGGVVQTVYADGDVRVILVDWDDYDDANANCAGVFQTNDMSYLPEQTRMMVESAQ